MGNLNLEPGPQPEARAATAAAQLSQLSLSGTQAVGLWHCSLSEPPHSACSEAALAGSNCSTRMVCRRRRLGAVSSLSVPVGAHWQSDSVSESVARSLRLPVPVVVATGIDNADSSRRLALNLVIKYLASRQPESSDNDLVEALIAGAAATGHCQCQHNLSLRPPRSTVL